MIQSHEELDVYQLAFKAAMKIFEVSKAFTREEVTAQSVSLRGAFFATKQSPPCGWGIASLRSQ